MLPGERKLGEKSTYSSLSKIHGKTVCYLASTFEKMHSTWKYKSNMFENMPTYFRIRIYEIQELGKIPYTKTIL